MLLAKYGPRQICLTEKYCCSSRRKYLTLYICWYDLLYWTRKKKNAIESFMYFFWKVLLLSRVWLFATLWTVTRWVPLSMEFSRQEYWNGLPFPTLKDFSTPGIKPGSPALQADFFFFKPFEPPRKPIYEGDSILIICLSISVSPTPMPYSLYFRALLAVFLSWMSFLKLHLKILSWTFGHGQHIHIFNQFEIVCVEEVQITCRTCMVSVLLITSVSINTFAYSGPCVLCAGLYML